MFNIKSNIFLNLTLRQKSSLLSFLKSFVKKNQTLSADNIIDKFIEDEHYYADVSSPRFEFALSLLDDDEFLRDVRIYINQVFEEIKYKEKQKPFIEKQKKWAKLQRQRANEYKMSKLLPTKKQLFYYEKIAKSHNIEMKDTKDATRLDLKNWIMQIIDPEVKDDE